jgi:hypothetical protein
VVTKNRLLAALAKQISQDHGDAPVTSTTMHALVWNHYNRGDAKARIEVLERKVGARK